ncbi:MAG: TlyA family RNA methyltransferase [Caulobacterales bacterium]
MARARLDRLLVERGLFESRAKARAAIEAGGVTVSRVVVAQPAALVDASAPIEATPAHDFVGRGALKLAHALATWPIRVEGRVVLDLGASTGGFTEVALRAGAALVYAVDVGRGQLHPKLVGDPRVVSLEATDARILTRELIVQTPEVIVCDLSFISLTKALGPSLALAASGADLVALVKPQFEAGRALVGKGGVVRDPEARRAAVEAVENFVADAGWTVRGRTPSPITGRDGNVEFLVWASGPARPTSATSVTEAL